MSLLNLLQQRRSIRKYTTQQITAEQLQTVLNAGVLAPTAGGRQGTIIVGVHNAEICAKIGRLNLAKFDRSKLLGSYVSKEQPSVIDDTTMQNGFYNAPSVCIVFAQRNFFFSIPDAFCAAENMVLQATELGLASCIISRAEDTFENPIGKDLMQQWNVPENYIARCFVILGHLDGEQPHAKPIAENRTKIIE